MTPRPVRIARITSLLGLALSACGGSDALPHSSIAPTSTATLAEPVTATWECPDGTKPGTRCLRVEVPADWDRAEGPMLSIPVVVVPATGPDRRPDPIVVPAGGPGGSITNVAGRWSDPHRDIVLYDQRGTGAAEPSLACPERDAAWLANLQRDASFDVERSAIAEGSARCRRRLEDLGVDFDDYDTEANVWDLDAVRRALGYDEWNILGISYGARLALAAMRATPDAIRSVILDSVSDVTAGGTAVSVAAAARAFEELVAACHADATCGAAHPDLAAEIDQVEARYNGSPIEVAVDLDDGAGPREFVITGSDAMSGIFRALYDPDLIPLLPGIIGDLAAGNTGIVSELVRQNVAFQGTIAWGMNLSVNCADYGRLEADTDMTTEADPGRFRMLRTETTCTEWAVEPASTAFNDPVTSEIPSLVVAGRFDPVTPPAGTEAVSSRLTTSTFALWPNRGHGVTGDPCAEVVMSAFLEDPTATVDLSCVRSLPGSVFG